MVGKLIVVVLVELTIVVDGNEVVDSADEDVSGNEEVVEGLVVTVDVEKTDVVVSVCVDPTDDDMVVSADETVDIF